MSKGNADQFVNDFKDQFVDEIVQIMTGENRWGDVLILQKDHRL